MLRKQWGSSIQNFQEQVCLTIDDGREGIVGCRDENFDTVLGAEMSFLSQFLNAVNSFTRKTLLHQVVVADHIQNQKPRGITQFYRARNTRGAIKLDLAITDFTQSFRRAFIGEEAVATSKVYIKLSERLGMNDSNRLIIRRRN